MGGVQYEMLQNTTNNPPGSIHFIMPSLLGRDPINFFSVFPVVHNDYNTKPGFHHKKLFIFILYELSSLVSYLILF